MAIPRDFSCSFYYQGGVFHTTGDVRGICPHCRIASTFTVKSNIAKVVGNWMEVRLIVECNYGPCKEQSFVFLRVHPGAAAPNATHSFYMYPSRSISPRHVAVPVPIAEDWEEAQKAMEASAVKAAAVMARRVLYGVLIEKGCKLHPLHEGCKELITKQRLPAMFDDWLPAIKDDGHDAAHPDRSLAVSAENLSETMAYTAELLRFTYIEPYEFNQRTARNALAKMKTNSP
jgi:Domain of unknown function (DUF4145)